ncbi:MAG: dihydrodipicolinate synthase family protein [Betaproteobacteria bacterium]|nr:dihydrodipicolinate synthase family protein [Betaproteobacteria bacterium]
MTAARLAGVLTPVLTPFNSDLAPDSRRHLSHCKWLLGAGSAALAVFGTTSEANSMSADERMVLLEQLVQGGVPADRLMPGTGLCALTDSVRLTRHAVALGCAGVLMLPPFYYKGVSDEGLYRSYAEIIERVGDSRLRLYLYHIPPVAQVGISLALIERLLARSLLAAFAKSGFDVFAGSEAYLLETLRAGGAGCITATGNVNSAAIDRLYRGWRSAEAERMQDASAAGRADPGAKRRAGL